jgi:hypothetical protein
MMKELALLGYFTSEIGYTKAMRYVESPGALRSVRGVRQGRAGVGAARVSARPRWLLAALALLLPAAVAGAQARGARVSR